MMPAKRPSWEGDLEKVRIIVGEYGLLIGPAGIMSEIITQTVAEGRKEGMALAR